MESIQQQISTLTQKVDQIYQILERSPQRVALDLDTQMIGGEEMSEHPLKREDIQRLRQNVSSYRKSGSANLSVGSNYRADKPEWIVNQQDILIDSSGVEISSHQIEEHNLSPQIQIQRLTAQLTAAYNRIAALEEQLLSKRWK
jgi:hypothetical protein